MAENDDQNADRQDQSEGYQDQTSDESTREARADSTPPVSQQQNQGTRRQDQGADLDEVEDSDEDRDDDERSDGGVNRRNNIG
jgi:hypothetical protein